MRKNSFKEDVMVCVKGGNGPYFICRDHTGMSVLRAKDADGKELFSPVLDNGKKNKEKERVLNVNLLYEVIAQKGGCPYVPAE